MELGRGNSIVVKNMDNDKTTSVEGIFAAGDAIYGTKSVIMAIESGRQAASQIDKYLGGDGDISEVLAPVQKADPYIGQCRDSDIRKENIRRWMHRRNVPITLTCLITVSVIQISVQKPDVVCSVI